MVVFSHVRLPDAPSELQRLAGRTRSACPVTTPGPARWWTDPQARPWRTTPRTSSAWCERAATLRSVMRRWVISQVVLFCAVLMKAEVSFWTPPSLLFLLVSQPRRRTYNGTKTIPHVVRPVEEVTELELQRICSNVREKVYNSSTVGPTFTLYQQ